MCAFRDFRAIASLRRLYRALAALFAARNGNVAPLLAVSIIPLVAAIGLSIDGARGWLVKSRLSQAIDAAGLAGGRVITSPTRDDQVRLFFRANFPEGYMDAVVDQGDPEISVDDPDAPTTITIKAAATIPTTFMRVVGKTQMRISAESVIERADRGMELVLVMDNTGSMHRDGKMPAMKAAATQLVNSLYGERETTPTLWVGLVPYQAIVNIGPGHIAWTKPRTIATANITSMTRTNSDTSSATMVVCATTTVAHSFYDGEIVDISGVTPNDYNGRHLIRNINTQGCSINASQRQFKFWYIMEGRQASVAAPAGASMQAQTPPTDYSQAGGRGWAGCVEARDNPYEEEDAEALPTTEDLQWTRAFWPSTRGMKFFNANKRLIPDWLPPASSPTIYSTLRDGDNDWGGDMDPLVTEETPSDYFAYGPNFGCGTAITPLQPSKTTALNAIAAMQPWGRSGTMSNLGLAWGWRVLSPNWRDRWIGAPAGFPLDPTPLISKVVILLTDGVNQWNDQAEVPPGCSGVSSCADSDAGLPTDADYTGYGRLRERRLGASIDTIAEARDEINSRTSRLCEAMKAEGIIIYTIVLQENDATTQQLFRDCATQPHTAYAYFSPTAAELAGIFQKIADQLANLRLAR